MQRKNKRPAAQMHAKTAVRKAKPKPSVAPKRSPAKTSRDKVRAYRKRMRAKGMRLVQMWVPDSKEPNSAEPLRQTQRRSRADAAAIRKAWAEVLGIQPPKGPVTFEDIAYLAGSVDGLPSDLSTNTKKYLRATGYGGKRPR
ncbi:MAG: antitoxin MazE-like protein [Xanthobacteraceae bacterium]